MRKRRVMAKAKVYGFSPWVDQVDAINQIMKETGGRLNCDPETSRPTPKRRHAPHSQNCHEFAYLPLACSTGH